jgi:hypothetical protein
LRSFAAISFPLPGTISSHPFLRLFAAIPLLS